MNESNLWFDFFEPGLGFGDGVLVIFLLAADVAHPLREFIGSFHQLLESNFLKRC